MYDLISIGNVTMDFFFKGDSLTYHDERFQLAVGGKYEAEYFHSGVGGGGANVAIGCSRHNLRTAIWSTIGENNFKHTILAELKEHHISTEYLNVEKDYTNISTILLTPSGERSIIHYNPKQSKIANLKHDTRMIKNTKVVYLGNMAHTSLIQKIDIARSVQKEGRLLVLNLGVEQCRKPKHELMHLLPHADVIIVNGHEFAELVKAPYGDIHFHEHIVKWYLPELLHKLFIVTEGSKGSFAYNEQSVFHAKPAAIGKIVDTTGAGDAYTGGFISSFVKHKNIERAMQDATHDAGNILQKMGAN